ncbi:glycosyltransferase family protein [Oceanirhabdus sp. W0125-5]|uniref:glycosyltransferase family protein n=1 Tax=Oceanirhabdus sp. W0125-5 TaxID=2999116 RepID=UPI0022F2F416|nr:glycosyltransferase family protein [Oceanirhabdus sp. W0125-5]WBW95451.1 glycosyltransferase family protein [Oceanirhabdus sp. W0125-5]
MKILCVVQARMGSERLPGKVVKPILGKPMILYTLDRLSKSRYIDKLVLATTDLPKEYPLINIVRSSGYECFTGDETNVLKRYKRAADAYEAEIIIRITGDCPLIDPIIVDNVVSNFLMYNYDYVRLDVPETFVRGFDVEVFSKEALNRVYEKVNKDEFKEHVTLYMYKHPEEFKVGHVKGEAIYNKPYRLCVDTDEDFKLINEIFKYFQDEYISSKDVIKFLDNNTDMVKINCKINQK